MSFFDERSRYIIENKGLAKRTKPNEADFAGTKSVQNQGLATNLKVDATPRLSAQGGTTGRCKRVATVDFDTSAANNAWVSNLEARRFFFFLARRSICFRNEVVV